MQAPRRSFLAGALALGAGACGGLDESEDDVKPWHMWGNSQSYPVIIGAAIGGVAVNSQQLVQVIYGRPETWKFLISAEIQNYDDKGIAPASRIINVLFDLQVGLGRSTQVLPAFARFDFELGTVGGPEVGLQRWAMQVAQPPTSRLSVVQTFTDSVTAENIQLGVRTIGAQGGNGYTFNVLLGAQFAPNGHVRPEWFTAAPDDHTRFRGGENKGL